MLTVEVIVIDEKLTIEVVDGNVFVVNVLIGVLFAMVIVFDDVYKGGFFLFCNSCRGINNDKKYIVCICMSLRRDIFWCCLGEQASVLIGQWHTKTTSNTYNLSL